MKFLIRVITGARRGVSFVRKGGKILLTINALADNAENFINDFEGIWGKDITKALKNQQKTES